MKALSLAEFRELVAAYGAVPERWPEPLREPARALLAASAEARALAAREEELDAVLQDCAPPPLSPAFERRLNEIPVRARRGMRFRPRALWAPALAWALAAVCGVWLGSAYPEEQTSEDVRATSESDEALLELASGAFVELEEEP
jgi:ferric-dicitrate binding protein FerR (iron transport regulator)